MLDPLEHELVVPRDALVDEAQAQVQHAVRLLVDDAVADRPALGVHAGQAGLVEDEVEDLLEGLVGRRPPFLGLSGDRIMTY